MAPKQQRSFRKATSSVLSEIISSHLIRSARASTRTRPSRPARRYKQSNDESSQSTAAYLGAEDVHSLERLVRADKVDRCSAVDDGV